MKKITSIVLAVLMIVTACITVLPVSAADSNPFKVGTQTYATLKAAYDALPAEGGTITMVADYNATSLTTIDISINKPIVIEGENHRIYNVKTYIFRAAGNVTLKNLTYEGTHGFRAMGGVLIDNVTATIIKGLFMNVQNSHAYTDQPALEGNCGAVTVQNSTITKSAGADPVLALYGVNRTLTIENSTVTRACPITDGAFVNQGVIGFGEANCVLNIKNSTIRNATDGSACNQYHSFVISSTQTTGTVNLLEGSVLEFSGSTYGNMFIEGKNFFHTDITVNDYGCQFKLTGDAAKLGARLPHADTLNGEAVDYVEYVSGNEKFMENSIVVNTAGDITYTAQKGTDSAVAQAKKFDATQVAAGNKFRIGAASATADDNYYTTFWDAYNAVTDGGTITQIAGLTTDGTVRTLTKNITLDGQGGVYGAAGGYSFTVKANLTLKNVYFRKIRIAFQPQGGANGAPQVVNMDRAILINNENGLLMNSSQGTFAANSKVEHTYTDCALISRKGGSSVTNQEVLLVRSTVDNTINVVDSTMLYMGSEKSYTVQMEYNATSNGKKQLNVKGTSVIWHSGTGTGTFNPIYAQNGAGNTVVMEAGTTMRIDKAANGNSNFTNTILPANYTDKGANYVVSAAVAKLGVTLPQHTTMANGDTVLGYTVNGSKLTLAASYADANATAPVTFKAVALDLSDFDTVDAASIRLSAPYGIRFGTEISKTLKDTLESYGTVEYGMVAARKELLTGSQAMNQNATVTAMDASCVKATMNQFYKDNVDGVYQYNLAIAIGTDPELNKNDGKTYQKTLQAAGYFTITVDGVSKTFYTENVVESSIYNVAQAYYNDTVNGSTTNATINGIIAACQPQS